MAMRDGRTPPTQKFATALIYAGFTGLLIRSFAHGATDTNLNLVLWRWNTTKADRLDVIDDEARLSQL
jgi:RES domain-containing protein